MYRSKIEQEQNVRETAGQVAQIILALGVLGNI
jgi:hypothetical protein